MAASVLRSETDRQRFTYLSIAIVDEMTKILQDLLQSKIPPADIKQAVQKFSIRLTKQQKIILDKAAKVGYREFDISLLYTLLRNVCQNITKPTGGWGRDEMPETSCVTVGDDIERIRIIRNNMHGHIASTSITETDFISYWNILSGICNRMENLLSTEYVNKLNGIRTTPIDNDLVERYARVLEAAFCRREAENEAVDRTKSYEAYIERLVQDEGDRRIILLGKVGAGKSASGNAILNCSIFESLQSWDSVTRKCMYGKSNRNGVIYRLFDTPGACAPTENKEVFQDEVKRCLYVTSPGFHCIALVISAAERITEEDKQLINSLDELLGVDSCKYMIIIFTKVKDEENLKSQIQRSKEITELTIKCEYRYVCFGNNDKHVSKEAVDKFDEMLTELMKVNAREGTVCYEHRLYKKAHSILEKDKRDLLAKNPDYTPDQAFEFVRQRAFDGKSPRDADLLKLTHKDCCVLI